ncbi:hypothetical protein BU26DRAFT_517470 [Trematosphaeria pertusa]|uniref:Uncharacterized protein n=1 Tax=Trematosphaeria pertusa TaxID=390896 RepID=A0A6A6IMD3_9PLEO|nr:uncharacterized protein BU26DRAFT_517470 [Trematosphaeria pertusa]KAF2250643.1 hypothetical protein BU26DRAFT_517470 [Trematosphaeria pertusa]
MRFDYARPPGVDASGIAIVPKNGVGDWSKCLLFTIVSGPLFKTQIHGFGINSKGYNEREALLQSLQTAEYLVFPDGKRAEIDAEDMGKFQSVIRYTKPLWDEYAILKRVNEEPQFRGVLLEGAVFGSWADAILSRIIIVSDRRFCWRMIGRDPRVAAPEDKLLAFKDEQYEDFVFTGWQGQDGYPSQDMILG